jgi:DNA-binding transcriptional MerR regulator/methylmalonyl-CoA mutase cobalamin-binding subunit
MKSPTGAGSVARHPIAVVSERTGLSQDVLRVWERRYRAVEPVRDAGGQRLYTSDDVERLVLLHAATRGGRTIRQVARMETADLRALVDEDRDARAARDPGAAAAPVERLESVPAGESHGVVDAALALARAFDGAQLDRLLRRAAARQGLSDFIESVAAPLLRRVGDEWHAGRVSPAQEHLVSSTVHDIASEALRAFRARDDAPRVVVATPAGDRHGIGAVLAGAAAAMEGWAVISLGADLPAGDIAAAARAAGAQLVALSVVLRDRPRVLDELRTLREQLAPEIAMIAGGPGAIALQDELVAAGIAVEPSLTALVAAMRRMRATTVTPRTALP